MRLVLTRPRAQARAWVRRLAAMAVDAVALPLIEIAPAADVEPVREAWLRLGDASFVMFVSANAVEQFFALRPGDRAWPGPARAGATGPGTMRALLAAGVPREQIDTPVAAAGRWDSEGLWQQLADRPWQGARVVVVRGQDGRDWLAERWRERGAAVDFVEAYRRLPPELDDGEQQVWRELSARPDEGLWHFSASEALHNLARLRPRWSGVAALVTHERIEATAGAMGFAPLELIAPTVEAAAAAWQRRAGAAGGSVQSSTT